MFPIRQPCWTEHRSVAADDRFLAGSDEDGGTRRPASRSCSAISVRMGRLPGFGQRILAPADGRVVRAWGWAGGGAPWSRNSWPALVYLFLDGSLREHLGPGGLLGNHVVLDLGDGVYARLPLRSAARSQSRRARLSVLHW